MSVAEKLKAEDWIESWLEGWAEGFEQGIWIGKIQILEEFLEKPPTAPERLNAMPSAELEALESVLHRE
jgi:hypothetical protein